MNNHAGSATGIAAEPDPLDELVDVIDLDAQPELDGADLADSEGGHHD